MIYLLAILFVLLVLVGGASVFILAYMRHLKQFD